MEAKAAVPHAIPGTVFPKNRPGVRTRAASATSDRTIPRSRSINESKHGILYQAFRDKMNMDKGEWVVGSRLSGLSHLRDMPYQRHSQSAGHSRRGRANLLDPAAGWSPRNSTNWKERRDKMKDVCRQCHGDFMVDGFYTQFDDYVELYNNKFAIPATNVRQKLMDMGKTHQSRFRRQAGLDLLRILASRRPPRTARRRHDGAGLRLVAWPV